MNTGHIRNAGTASDVDKYLVGFENFIIDDDSICRLKAGVPLNDGAVRHSSEPFFHSLTGGGGGCILAGFDSRHIDAQIANGETVFRTSTGNVDRISTRDERLCRCASCIYACAAKFIALDYGDILAGACE